MKLADLRPGWASDFMLHREGGLVTEREDCIVVRTPANPTFYWGNFLLLPQAPADGALAHWLGRFDAEIGAMQPESLHAAFGINAPPLDERLPAWQAAGFERIASAVLRLQPGGLRAPAGKADLCSGSLRSTRFAPLDLERDLEAIVTLECADIHGFEPVGYAEYRRRELRRVAALARQGRAAWFGVWCDGVLAADCGLLHDGSTGRFQRVATHPHYRRRGLCSALVHGVSAWGFTQWRLASILMCADPRDVAIGIYTSLGYERIDSDWCLQRNAPQDRARSNAAAPGALPA